MTTRKQAGRPVLDAVVPRDFPQRSIYYVQLDRERLQSPEACDILLNSSEGTTFTAHKEVLCENSEFFRAMFTSQFIECRDNECQLKTIDEPTLKIILDYFYRKDVNISDDMMLPVFAASHFFSLTWLQAYCAAGIARRPFEAALEHPLFLDYVKTHEGIVDLILDLDLLLTANIRLQNLLSTWPIDEDTRLRAIADRLRKKSRQRRELAIIFERSVGYAVTFTGNRTQQWLEPSGFKIPLRSQHIAIAHDHLYYATGWLVGIVDNDVPVYKECNDGGLIWPPLLRRYGSSSVIWTENKRGALYRRSLTATNSNVTKERFTLRNDSMVRHIPSTDSMHYPSITVVVTTKGIWEVLRWNGYDYDRSNFENLECPLERIECAAIMQNRLYVIGSKTASSVLKTMLAYDEKDLSWLTLCERKRDVVPGAFLPLNGRLYILSNGLPTVEVYEPHIDSWMLDEMHEFVQIGGFSIIRGQA